MAKHIVVLLDRNHQDEALLEHLEAHIVSLERKELATFWHPGHVQPGTSFRETIDRQMDIATREGLACIQGRQMRGKI